MKKSLFLLLVFALSIPGFVLAQSFKLIDGNFDVIKKEKKVNLEFTYENMGVGKFEKEEDYVKQKIADYNEKEPGRGEKWAASWIADRKNRYQPNFVQLYDKYAETQMVGDYKDAKYTMIMNTFYTEPGYNIYVSKKNALINADFLIVETADRSKVIAKIRMMKAPGRTMGGDDYDTGARIEESYAVAGKRLALFIMK
ncbi:MAG: hypothetical protein KA444_09785 [Bacteroidia bacterium]|nr:hypothetical protein [Bacteroidia bacterium]